MAVVQMGADAVAWTIWGTWRWRDADGWSEGCAGRHFNGSGDVLELGVKERSLPRTRSRSLAEAPMTRAVTR